MHVAALLLLFSATVYLCAAQATLHTHLRDLHSELVDDVCGSASSWVNITAYGAIPDNATLARAAIQAALDAAAARHTLTCVYVPAGGAFLTGTVNLSSNVYLLLEDGAVLQGSHNPDDYSYSWDYWNMVQCLNCSNTGVIGRGSGTGAIVGSMWQMIAFYDPTKNQLEPVQWDGVRGCVGECRPRNVAFYDCVNITMFNMQLLDSSDWTSLYRRVSNLLIQGLVIEGSRQWPNNDGMDVESGQNVTIADMVIRTGDDGICFASGNTNNLQFPWPQPLDAYSPVAHVRVRNVTVTSISSAIKFEAIFQAQHGDIYDVVIDGVQIESANRGIGFQQRTGNGSIHDIAVLNANISTQFYTGAPWWGAGEAIWITSVPENAGVVLNGGIWNVSFTNVRATAENAALVTAKGGGSVSGVTFTNVSLAIAQRSNVTHPGHDYRPIDASSPLPAQVAANVDGFFLESALDVAFVNVSVAFLPLAQPFWDNGVCVNATAGSTYTQSGCSCAAAPT